MKRLSFLFSLLLCGGLFAQTSVQLPYGLKPIPGEFIVKIKGTSIKPVILQAQDGSTDREANFKLTSALRTRIEGQLAEIAKRNGVSQPAAVFADATVAMLFSNISDDLAKRISQDPDVESVTPNFVFQFPQLPLEFPKISTQQTTCAVSTAGGPIDGSGKATWIWILDTGIDLDHPDLNVQTSATFAKSFIAGETVEDGHGHGTHVAGIAAARNNLFGVVGVSAGARVVPVKVLSNAGGGSFAGVLNGLNHVAMYDIRGDVINMSLGAYPISNCENSNAALRDAIRNLGTAGTFVVMAAGNDGDCAGSSKNLPGCVNGTNVFTVGSMTCEKACSSFSNWGNPSVDWVAVGSSVYSTYKNGGYATMSGTSMASPVVAGIIHARGGAPLSAGTITCCNGSYRIAKR
ncbi:MAG: S8 family peptidase [Haliscomenobacter sp.]